jgi:hypothetical protein
MRGTNVQFRTELFAGLLPPLRQTDCWLLPNCLSVIIFIFPFYSQTRTGGKSASYNAKLSSLFYSLDTLHVDFSRLRRRQSHKVLTSQPAQN